jgi:hypothetical protein
MRNWQYISSACLTTKSMEQNLSGEAESFSATQEIILYGRWKFTAVFTAACHWILFRSGWIQCRMLQLISLVFIFTCMRDYRRGFGFVSDLLTTYTHNSELEAITAPPLISTIHKTPQHTLSLFQPAMSSLAVPWQRLLTLKILQLRWPGLSFTEAHTELTILTKLQTSQLYLGTDYIENIPFPLL